MSKCHYQDSRCLQSSTINHVMSGLIVTMHDQEKRKTSVDTYKIPYCFSKITIGNNMYTWECITRLYIDVRCGWVTTWSLLIELFHYLQDAMECWMVSQVFFGSYDMDDQYRMQSKKGSCVSQGFRNSWRNIERGYSRIIWGVSILQGSSAFNLTRPQGRSWTIQSTQEWYGLGHLFWARSNKIQSTLIPTTTH